MATLWEIALVPLLVLPFILLFRFAGCGLDVVGTGPAEPALPPRQPPQTPPEIPPGETPGPTEVPVRGGPPNYRKYILGLQPNPGDVKNPSVVPNGGAVIAYWRLVDAVTPATATDEKGARNGIYVAGTPLTDTAPTTALGGSEAAPGLITPGQPGLIISDPAALCRSFNGGYVQVPYSAGLHTDEFTLEAWVNIAALKPNYEHVLFDSGGRYAQAGSAVLDRGYRVLADRTGAWQVRLTSNQTAVFTMPPKVPLGARTHFALVLKNHDAAGVKKDLTLYIDAKEAATATIPTYQRPDDAPLYMAVENTAAQPTQPAQLRAPFLGQIQEVVLHSKPLSVQELENHVDMNR